MALFGTDGVRGIANIELTPELALSLGQSAGHWVRKRGGKKVVIGRDTRRSGTMIGASLAAGFASAGIDVTTLGVAPTPTVSFAARTGDFSLGAVISASHNPAQDNGIKFLGSDGGKLPVEVEAMFENQLSSTNLVSPADVGRISPDNSLESAYLNWLLDLLPQRLEGYRIAVDAANGAAYSLGVRLFEMLGAQVFAMGTEPDGDNINFRCGATHPALIQDLTIQTKSHVGISFDGDADRCVFSDEQGHLINGDRLMGIWAAFELSENRLNPKTIVGTVMSNMGFENALRELGINLERVSVGDRNVSQKLQELGAKIGGEQSGHIVFSDFSPTGDGLLTAIQLLKVMRLTGCAASELSPRFENWPQVLVNIQVKDRNAWKSNSDISDSIKSGTDTLANTGRVLVRASGTQPMIRVMVEAKSEWERDKVADVIVSSFIDHAGGEIKSRTDLTHALGD